MKLSKLWFNKKILIIFILLTILFLSGIISSICIDKAKSGWESRLKEKIEYTKSVITHVFDEKISSLIISSQSIKNAIRLHLTQKDLRSLFSQFENSSISNQSIQVYNSKYDLIGWNSEPIVNSNDISSIIEKKSQVFFRRDKLSTYLIILDTLNTNGNTYYYSVGTIIEKHFKLATVEFDYSSITDSLSQMLSTSIKIDFNEAAQLLKDGRQHSFIITNNFKNKIGVVSFEKPALDTELENIFNITIAIQSLLILLIYFTVGYFLISYCKKIRKRYFKFVVVSSYFVVLRVLLFAFGIPSLYIRNSLTDSSNFSSVFAYGVVRSPLEFSITILFILGIVLYGYKLSLQYFDKLNNRRNNWWKFSIVSLLSFGIFLITLRGFAASIRSVVFDSTIRYFKDFSLIPSPLILIMDLNILFLGICTILFSIILLKLIFNHNPINDKKKSNILFFSLFLLLLILGWIYDAIQKQPQGTPLIRIIYITIVYWLAYFTHFNNRKRFINFLYYGFAASIVSVSLLTYYNSEIEKESLKTTAQELTRANKNIYEFMIYQTLTQTQNNEEIINSIQEGINSSSSAFILWTKSLLYRESVPASIEFYDASKKYLGGFSNTDKILSSFILDSFENNDQQIKIYKQINPYTSETTLSGFLIIEKNNSVAGYIEISALYNENYYRISNLPKFLIAPRAGIASALDYEKLKVFTFRNGELITSYGGTTLSKREVEQIVNAPNKHYNEAWLRIELNNDKYLVYVLRDSNDKSKVVAVSLEEKKFSWNLSNFFKVFFIHIIILIGIFFLFSLWRFKSWKSFFESYRTRLFLAFVVFSLIPLLVIAIYFRYLTEGKNTELINNRLTDFGKQVELYLKNYSNNSTINTNTIFSKAAQDLNIRFTIFRQANLLYSTDSRLYDVGLLQTIISPRAFLDCILSGFEKTFFQEAVENDSYHSVYLKSRIGDEVFIIQVNDLLNNLSLPLSDVELDLFLFGIFSLAVILIIIFSTILAEQISLPIRKLTHAARSVGSGDLNVEVIGYFKGDIKELTDGFNNMVNRLRKSQLQMVQLERENAWKEMAKQVAHEIKNPLTPMKLAVQQLITASKDKSRKFEVIFEKVTSTILTQIETLRNIASEFSNFARMPKLNIEKINVADIVRETLNLFSDEKLTIKFASSLEAVCINADRDHISRTMINLIRNSIQANAKYIFVEISVINNSCKIRITDDGEGIPVENIEKIFEENFTTKPQGMGLGLSMAKRFIESINGRIIIESTSPSGTTFLLTFPITE